MDLFYFGKAFTGWVQDHAGGSHPAGGDIKEDYGADHVLIRAYDPDTGSFVLL